jgi:ABC-2 type transport system ATP-binding protein
MITCTTIGFSQVRYDTFITVAHNDSVDAVYFYPNSSPPPSGYPAILDVHGFGLSKETEIPFCTIYAAKGYVTLAYSVRGHGASSGLSTIMSTDERSDLTYVLSFLRSLPDVDTNSVGIVGSSQGGLHGLYGKLSSSVKTAKNQ